MCHLVRKSSLTHLLIFIVCAFSLVGCTSSIAFPPSHTREALQNLNAVQSKSCLSPSEFIPEGSSNHALVSNGLQRTYRVHLPVHYQAHIAYPLVLNFHGHNSNAMQQEQRSGFSRLADQQGFIVVYPQGLVGPDHATGWATRARQAPQVDDIHFVSDLLTRLQASFCIDPQRIYATGFSNGGAMTNLLACKLSNRFAAFAPVAGSYSPVKGGCQPQRPVSILEIHGTADTVVPYNGSPSRGYQSVASWLQGWIDRDGCRATPEVVYAQRGVLGEEWSGCKGKVALIHYRIAQGKHVWPQETNQRGIDATHVIWTFFQKHSL